MSEPIINPWLIYLASVANVLKATCGFIAICSGAGMSMAYLCGVIDLLLLQIKFQHNLRKKYHHKSCKDNHLV